MNGFKFFKSYASNESDSWLASRMIGLTDQSYKVQLNNSDIHDYCWWTLRGQNVSIAENDTSFAYSDVEANLGGVIFGLESAAGTLLNSVLIVALLKNSEIRKEYITKTIISILITDFLFSVFFLPIQSLRFFKRYKYIFYSF